MGRNNRVPALKICKNDCFHCPFPDCRSNHMPTSKENKMMKAGFYTPDISKAWLRFLRRFELTPEEERSMIRAAACDFTAHQSKRGRPRKMLTPEEEAAKIERQKAKQREYYYANRERLNTQRKEKRKKEKEAKRCLNIGL